MIALRSESLLHQLLLEGGAGFPAGEEESGGECEGLGAGSRDGCEEPNPDREVIGAPLLGAVAATTGAVLIGLSLFLHESLFAAGAVLAIVGLVLRPPGTWGVR